MMLLKPVFETGTFCAVPRVWALSDKDLIFDSTASISDLDTEGVAVIMIKNPFLIQ